jgi:hypothetical protein
LTGDRLSLTLYYVGLPHFPRRIDPGVTPRRTGLDCGDFVPPCDPRWLDMTPGR